MGGGAGVGGRWRRGEEGSAAARGEEGFPVSPWMTMAMVGEAETFLRERKSREEVYWADTLLVALLGRRPNVSVSFFLSFFICILFFNLSKINTNFFFQICHPAAGSSGGTDILPDGPAVGSVGHGLTTNRRMNWR